MRSSSARKSLPVRSSLRSTAASSRSDGGFKRQVSANLTQSNLAGANLIDARLDSSDLDEVNLLGANVRRTILERLNRRPAA
ncbi:MAG: hypothetical protein EXQ91_05595 [Alphaproteobacteria bacterium]|nr:hypothetical protein [Alphaproteobacteria bacterium]